MSSLLRSALELTLKGAYMSLDNLAIKATIAALAIATATEADLPQVSAVAEVIARQHTTASTLATEVSNILAELDEVDQDAVKTLQCILDAAAAAVGTALITRNPTPAFDALDAVKSALDTASLATSNAVSYEAFDAAAIRLGIRHLRSTRCDAIVATLDRRLAAIFA